MTTRILPFAFAAGLGVPPSAGALDQDAIMEGMREALGAATLSEPRDWIVTGSHRGNGSENPISLRFHANGAFRRHSLGELGTMEAWDGRGGVQADWNGLSGPLELATLGSVQLEIWVTTGAWLATPGLVDVVSVEKGPAEDEVSLLLQLHDGPLRGRLVVDARTFLPKRLESRRFVDTVCEFHDFTDVGGLRLPGRVDLHAYGDLQSSTTWTGAAPTALDRPAYLRLPDPPQDARFTAASGEVPLHFAPTGHLLVDAAVDGRKLGSFVFDTGAGQAGLRTDYPEDLEPRRIGETMVLSIFGPATNPVLRTRHLAFGPLEVDDPLFVTMDLAPLEAYFGEPLGGFVGYGILRRAIVELDLQAPSLRVHDPARYDAPDDGWFPLHFQENHPMLEVEIEGRRGFVRLDLGASGGPHGNLVVHAPAVRSMKLLEGRDTEEATLGEQTVALGKLRSLEIGGKRFEDLDVVFGLGEEGLFHDDYAMANVGVGVLSHFRIVFDYANRRVRLTPRDESPR